jgi:predicted nuclease of predicted toxin-antitoxin system
VNLKTDENISRTAVDFLRNAGHDVETAVEEGLQGASDARLFRACTRETRTLLTLDRGFGEVLRFPPSKHAGIVILQVGPKFTFAGLIKRLSDFLEAAKTNSVEGSLWVVEPGRLRVHDSPAKK